MCDSLKLRPKPNNGTLRLPLKTVGVHTDENAPETPSDPVPLNHAAPPPAHTDENAIDAVISISPIEASSAADPLVKPPHFVGVDIPEKIGNDNVSVERPVVDDEKKKEDGGMDFLAWMKKKLDGVKDWLGDKFGGKAKGD